MHNRVLRELASVISTAKGQFNPTPPSFTIITTKGGTKTWHGRLNTVVPKKGRLDLCDDWVLSADLSEWDKHLVVIRRTTLKPDIVIHLPSTQQFIMVELAVLSKSRMKKRLHLKKKEKYKHLTRELVENGYRAKIMPIDIGTKGFVGSSAYNLLSKLLINVYKQTKALKLLAETAEKSFCWIWSRRNQQLLQNDQKCFNLRELSWLK
ncbi:reverse transcriptase [Elysia marginata]|uniref:Reverse transcriptase n=1 Tax=Elysia marginata TaxID=1093978 RepID=A0AAV4JCH5_9GAST|nr:reverse transcriptase [Elysia marginata]